MQLITYFEKFVSNIQPSSERISAVAEAHNELRKHLKEDAELKFAVSESFLSGSYGRSTATAPIKDVDIIFVMATTEISDDRKSPSPRAVLRDLKGAIDDYYEEVNLETQRRSIQVELTEDEIRMDVVPAIAPDGSDKQLFVPDYEQQKWIPSHPKEHIENALGKNKASNGRFVRLVKAFKWWRSKHFSAEVAPKSFLLEVIVGEYFDEESTNLCRCFEGTAKNILRAFQSNYDNCELPSVPDPGVPDDNLTEACGWTVANFKEFVETLKDASEVAAKANNDNTNKEDTVKLWQKLFGKEYPSTLSDSEDKAITQSLIDGRTLPPRGLPHIAQISARLAKVKHDKTYQDYPNTGGRSLPKGVWVRFKLEGTDVPPPYRINWLVTNHGKEAREAQKLSHNRLSDSRFEWYTTAYKGHHFMDCQILKFGRVVAQARCTVNIR